MAEGSIIQDSKTKHALRQYDQGKEGGRIISSLLPFRMRMFRSISVATLFTLVALPVQAAIFPDVPAGYPYKKQIDKLVFQNVITGNADGTFKPSTPVNRAAMVVLLYRAMGKTPAEPEKICMSDIVPGSWYEAAVCHALGQRFVAGYAGGTFEPNKAVTRAEALKMIETIMEFDLSLDSIKNYQPPVLHDVSATDWFANYVYFGYLRHILPIDGWTGDTLSPNSPLSRGEAAALIYNALSVKNLLTTPAVGASSSSLVALTEEKRQADMQQKRDEEIKKADERAKEVRMKTVNIPFSDSETFIKKKPYSYNFTVKQTATIEVVATLASAGTGSMSARLYYLADTGISSEYYLSFTEKDSAYLRVTLKPGKYQIDLQPVGADNSTYSVSAKLTASDSNDGFSVARNIDATKLKTDVLEPNDLADYFSFSVTGLAKDELGKTMTVDAVSQGDAKCLIYGLDNVDYYGETFPECGKSYLYPAGNYIIAVMRGPKASRAEKLTYTVKLTK
ncbi:MAG: N-acetylmuramoyl-L-alanine amidase [Candidatus Peribacteria bacterium]|nr:N-acetylmuramoyl-L-alanine amidase [Candidatus Peribacteria bacterium]